MNGPIITSVKVRMVGRKGTLAYFKAITHNFYGRLQEKHNIKANVMPVNIHIKTQNYTGNNVSCY